MKKITTTLILSIVVFSSFAQNSGSNKMFIHHDTITLKANECRWIIESLTSNYPNITDETGKSVPWIILQAIEKGKLKGMDLVTNKEIPAKEIYTWGMPADTMVTSDNAGNTKYKIVHGKRNSDNISSIRIYQDWYFDITTGKFRADIKWVELLEEVYSSSGLFIGYKPLCKINY